MVRQVAAHAELTAEAAVTGNRALAVEALALHPLIRSVGTAELAACLPARACRSPATVPGDVNPFDAHPPLALDDVLATVVDGRTKGMPAHEVALGEVPARRLPLTDLSLPVMSLRSSALEHNDADRRLLPPCAFAGTPRHAHRPATAGSAAPCRRVGTDGRHGAAGPGDARRRRASGDDRQRTRRPRIDPMGGRLPGRSVSRAVVVGRFPRRGIPAGAGMRGVWGRRAPSRPGELGHPGGRTGARSMADAIEVAASVAASPVLELRGVAGYEGTVCAERRPECLAVRRYLGDLHALSVAVLLEGFIDERHEMLVTAGGSTFFDLAAEALTPPRPEHAGASAWSTSWMHPDPRPRLLRRTVAVRCGGGSGGAFPASARTVGGRRCPNPDSRSRASDDVTRPSTRACLCRSRSRAGTAPGATPGASRRTASRSPGTRSAGWTRGSGSPSARSSGSGLAPMYRVRQMEGSARPRR